MKPLPVIIVLFAIMNTINAQQKIQAPVCEKRPKILEIHGDKRTDNYYWLNDYWLKGPDSAEVVDYLKKENDYFYANMKHTESLQEKLYNEMLGRIKQTDQSVPYFKNGYWYITKTEEGKEYAKYTRRKSAINAEPEELLLDANEEGAKHKFYAISTLAVSPDNKILAYAVDTLSRRKYSIFFKDIETGELLNEIIPVATGEIVWANDNKTIFYCIQNDTTLRSERVMKHIIGTPVSADQEVYFEKEETYNASIEKSKDDDYIFIYSESTLSTEVRYIKASKPESAFKIFVPREKDMLYDVEHRDNEFYIRTNWNAKNFRLMKCPVNNTAKENWHEEIGNRPDVLLSNISVFNDYLVLSERTKATTQIRVIKWADKSEYYLQFKEDAYVASVAYNPDFNATKLRYNYQSMVTPPSTFEVDMATKENTLLKQQEVLGGFNADDYQTERLWVTAHDGTKVPLSIVFKKGFKKDGTQPLLLYGYGSYGYSMDPSFSIARISLLNRGFAFAIAHIRGGQEMGRQWYENGKMFHKKNTFTDFIDCADFLIKNKYTSSKHLYANGGSAGGLLMGAVINMRPELWHGVIASVLFVDVVTTMLDESIPLTTGEFDEWGNPKNKDSYFYMKSYSPYDNVQKKAYPNMLVTTGLHDSQVQYFEPAKWVAKLRELKTDNNKLLLYTNMDVGHGGASGRFQRLKEVARDYAFMIDLEGGKE